jgi:hypothetical protein
MKFRRKPVTVDAVQFTNPDGPLPEGIRREEARWAGSWSDQSFFNKKYGSIYKFFVDTLEGPLEIKVGDWIVTGIVGERFPVKPDIFVQTYEPIEDKG